MTSSAYGFRRRLITVSICLCVFLAFSATLSANSATFVLGNANSSAENFSTGESLQTKGVPVGPYPGTLSNSSINMFFCITGGYTSNWDTSYSGNDQPANVSAGVPNVGTGVASVQQQEEVAFLASMFLSIAKADGISLVTSVSNGKESLTESGSSLSNFVNTVQGPIQMAIWDIMNNFPTDNYNITKPAATGATATLAGEMATFEADAQKAWTTLLNPNLTLNTTITNLVADFNAHALIFVPTSSCPTNQSFVAAYYDQTLVYDVVPEPGTMVLFGAGGLLMALGCGRKLLAKRRSR